MSGELFELYQATVSLIAANPIPFSMAASAVVGYALGKISGKRAAKRDPAEVEEENRRLNKEANKHKQESRSNKKNADRLNQVVDKLTDERNRYQKIAETREINISAIPERQVETVRVWKRAYNALPLDNLKALKKDLTEYKDHHLILQIRVEPIGGWKKHMTNFNLKREGSVDHVINELKTMIRDLDYGFVKERPYSATKEWVDDDSPIRFIVALDVVYRYDVEPPEIHTVEVAATSTQIEKVEIEKVVFIEDEGDVRNPMGGHSRDEIIEIVKEYDLRKQGEVELDRLLPTSLTKESPEERAADAMRRNRAEALSRKKQSQ
jgi:hypothetical protein